jgi:hypothetical protein
MYHHLGLERNITVELEFKLAMKPPQKNINTDNLSLGWLLLSLRADRSASGSVSYAQHFVL